MSEVSQSPEQVPNQPPTRKRGRKRIDEPLVDMSGTLHAPPPITRTRLTSLGKDSRRTTRRREETQTPESGGTARVPRAQRKARHRTGRAGQAPGGTAPRVCFGDSQVRGAPFPGCLRPRTRILMPYLRVLKQPCRRERSVAPRRGSASHRRPFLGAQLRPVFEPGLRDDEHPLFRSRCLAYRSQTACATEEIQENGRDAARARQG